MIAHDETHSWSLIAIGRADEILSPNSATTRLLERHFERVTTPPNWRDHFGLSRRHPGYLHFYESRTKYPQSGIGGFDARAWSLVRQLAPILGMTTSESYDAWVAPSLYKSKMLSMPPSLARYALAYYASSLVRYKPQMFDARGFPEQAYLFDAIARECALPMLQDVLAGISGRPTFFRAPDALRL